MNKKILSLAIAAITIFSVNTAFAQQTNNQKAVDKKDGKEQMKRERSINQPQAVNPFEGLNLTEQQQTALKALAGEQREGRKQKSEDKKAEKQNQMEAQKNARKEYLAKVKAILTPEQYCQFLENNFVNQAPKSVGNNAPRGNKGNAQRSGNRSGRSDRRN